MTNKTEKAGATPVLAGPCFRCGNVKIHREGCEVAPLHAELSALRASQQAPVEGLPDGCPRIAYWDFSGASPALFTDKDRADKWGGQMVEINTPGTAARLAALENKEK